MPALASTLAALLLVWLVPTLAAAELGGTVRDRLTKEPVASAVVTVQATSVQVVTDRDGRYRLPTMPAPGVRVVAGAKGYFNEGMDAPSSGWLDFELDHVPYVPDAPIALMSPAECKTCHQVQHAEWETSPMGHAGTNSWVLDLYSGEGTPGGKGGFVYTRDSVHAGRNPKSECASCHQPESWLADPGTALRKLDDPHPSVGRGVSCLACHLVAHVDETKLSFPGFHDGAATVNRGGSPVRYGTLGDVDYFAPNRMRASYQPQLSSVLCAVCHQDSADPSGDGKFDGIVSEPTYGEWKESAYGDPESPHFSSCMECHSDANNARRASFLLTDPARPSGQMRTHTFEGTTPRFLENAVLLRLDASLVDGEVVVDAAVENHATGHHVPTGVTMRNMILLVEATDAEGALVHTGAQTVDRMGGEGDPAKGYYAGLPGKLYGKIDRAADGSGPTFFSEAVFVESDTRIPALETDHTRYTFEARGSGAVTVRARVIYRRGWRAVVDAKEWKTDGHGRPLADLAPPHFGHLMASADTRVFVPSEGCGCAASGPGWFAVAALALLLLRRSKRKGA